MNKQEFLHRLKTDINFFSVKVHKIDLARNPKQLLFAQSCLKFTHTVACFSRQTGKSTALAICATHALAFGDHVSIGIYAPTKDQSIGVMFNSIVEMIRDSPILYSMVSHPILKGGAINMKNGNTLRAFTANKDTKSVRGFSPTHIIIDESQDVVDDIYFGSILPSGAAIKGLRVGSDDIGVKTKYWEAGTPAGRNHFMKYVQKSMPAGEAPDGTRIVKVVQPWYESTTVDRDLVEDARANYPRLQFEAEYECKFNFDTGFAFDWKQVDDATVGHNQRSFYREQDGIYVGGVDLGRNRDHTVLTIFEWNPPVWKMVGHKQWDTGLLWEEIFSEMTEMFDFWRPQYTIVDKGGIGDIAYEAYFDRLPWSCLPWIFTVDSKLKLIHNAQRLLEHDDLWLWDEIGLVQQLKDMPEERNGAGKPIYNKIDKKHHDDRVWSMVMALMAGKLYIGEGESISYGSKGKTFDDFFNEGMRITSQEKLEPIEMGLPKRSRWLDDDPYSSLPEDV